MGLGVNRLDRLCRREDKALKNLATERQSKLRSNNIRNNN